MKTKTRKAKKLKRFIVKKKDHIVHTKEMIALCSKIQKIVRAAIPRVRIEDLDSFEIGCIGTIICEAALRRLSVPVKISDS